MGQDYAQVSVTETGMESDCFLRNEGHTGSPCAERQRIGLSPREVRDDADGVQTTYACCTEIGPRI